MSRCDNCQAEGTGCINGRWFCSKPKCIDKVIAGVVRPISQLYSDAIQGIAPPVERRSMLAPDPEDRRTPPIRNDHTGPIR